MDIQAKIIHRELFRLKPMLSSICPCGGTLVSRSVVPGQGWKPPFRTPRGCHSREKPETMITSDFFFFRNDNRNFPYRWDHRTQSICPSLCDASSQDGLTDDHASEEK
jgi:hypothetical protein